MVETRSMKQKRQRLMMQISSWPDVPAIFETLNDDTLTTTIEFLGPKSYSSFGGINKQCRETYLETKGMTKQTFLYGYAHLSVIIDRIETASCCDRKLHEAVAIGVVFYNRKDVLYWALQERKKNLLKGICNVAAMEERFDLLEEVWSNVEDEENNREYIFGDFDQYAARHGKLEILKWFGTKVLYFNRYGCAGVAVKHGQLHVLQWLQEVEGMELGGALYYGAIEGGHFHVMKWLREKEVPWCERTFKFAVYKGNLSILQWLHDEGCPWPEDDDYHVFEAVLKPEVVDWLRANGYGDNLRDLF